MTVALQYTNVANRVILILTILHSGFVGGTTEHVNPFSLFQSSVRQASFKSDKTRVDCTAPLAS